MTQHISRRADGSGALREMAYLGVEDPRSLAAHLYDQLLVHRYLSAKQQARRYPGVDLSRYDRHYGDRIRKSTRRAQPLVGSVMHTSQYRDDTIMSCAVNNVRQRRLCVNRSFFLSLLEPFYFAGDKIIEFVVSKRILLRDPHLLRKKKITSDIINIIL